MYTPSSYNTVENSPLIQNIQSTVVLWFIDELHCSNSIPKKWSNVVHTPDHMANKCVYSCTFLWRLKKFNLAHAPMLQFYNAIIESILTSSIMVWFGFTTSWEKGKFHYVIRATTFLTAELRREQLRQLRFCTLEIAYTVDFYRYSSLTSHIYTTRQTVGGHLIKTHMLVEHRVPKPWILKMELVSFSLVWNLSTRFWNIFLIISHKIISEVSGEVSILVRPKDVTFFCSNLHVFTRLD